MRCTLSMLSSMWSPHISDEYNKTRPLTAFRGLKVFLLWQQKSPNPWTSRNQNQTQYMFPLSIQNQSMWCNSQTRHCLIWTAVQKRCTSNIEKSFYRQWKGRMKVQTLRSGHCQVCSVYPYACCLSGKHSLGPGQFPIFLWSCIFSPVTVILPCQFLGLWHCLIAAQLHSFESVRDTGLTESTWLACPIWA